MRSVKTEPLKSRKQVRIYLDAAHTEALQKCVNATELPETTICNAIVAAGLAALTKRGGAIHFPLRLTVDDPKKS